MANGYLYSAFETSVGSEANTPTLSTKVIYHPLLNSQPALGAAPLSRDDELRNVDEPLAVISEAYNPSWSLDTRAYPDTVGFEFKGMLGAPTTTTGNGVITDPDSVAIPTGAYRHVWTAPYSSGASPQTTTRKWAYKDETFFLLGQGCSTTNITIDSPASGGVMLKANGPANYLGRISDPSLSPAYEALTIPPFERAHLTISTWLGSTATTEDFNVQIDNPVEQVRTLASASKYPDLVEKGDGPVVVSGSIPKRHINTTDYDALINATSFTVKVKWQSTVVIGATTYKYALWLELNNAQYTGGDPDALQNKRRHGASFNWKATYGGSAGSSKWTLVNATSSYA